MKLMLNPAPPTARRPYAPPVISRLGALAERTAGPDGGDFDQIVGTSGGFEIEDPS